MQRCSRGSVESTEQPRQERKPAARMNVSSKHRRASRGVDRSATTSSITSALDHEAEAGTTVKNNVTVATLNKCWKAMVTFWRNELSHGPQDDERARYHAIRLIDIFGFHRDRILNCLGDLTELRLLHVEGREAAVQRLTDTLIGKRNMIKTPAFKTSITSLRSRFPELIRDLEARVDESIQFVQTTVINTIDMALADFNSLQSEPEKESKVETCGIDSNLLYEPTADEMNCEEEMQARATTTIGHVRARVAVGLAELLDAPEHEGAQSCSGDVSGDIQIGIRSDSASRYEFTSTPASTVSSSPVSTVTGVDNQDVQHLNSAVDGAGEDGEGAQQSAGVQGSPGELYDDMQPSKGTIAARVQALDPSRSPSGAQLGDQAAVSAAGLPEVPRMEVNVVTGHLPTAHASSTSILQPGRDLACHLRTSSQVEVSHDTCDYGTQELLSKATGQSCNTFDDQPVHQSNRGSSASSWQRPSISGVRNERQTSITSCVSKSAVEAAEHAGRFAAKSTSPPECADNDSVKQGCSVGSDVMGTATLRVSSASQVAYGQIMGDVNVDCAYGAELAGWPVCMLELRAVSSHLTIFCEEYAHLWW